MNIYRTLIPVDENLNYPVTLRGQQERGSAFGVSLQVNIPTAHSELPLLLLRNPSGSNKSVLIGRSESALFDTLTGESALIRFYLNPTVTNTGASLEISPIGSGVPSSLASSLPLVSKTGTRLPFISRVAFNIGTQSKDFERMKVAPGESFLVTGNSISNNTVVYLTLLFYEVPLNV